MPLGAAAAQSYDENPSGHALYVLLDGRLTASDGEPAWLPGGFGKARFGGGQNGDTRFRARPVEANVVWQPRLTWSLDATIAVTAQQGQEHPVDLSEAYLSYRHDPVGPWRASARLGLMWPPVSLEHSGPAWSVTDTISPSAINAWIGEEVKAAAAEASLSRKLGEGRVTGTVALFGFNDTAGTLLAFRGWALHDEKATAFGQQPLPPLDAFMQTAQAPKTRPVIELDNRPGFYAKLGWSGAKANVAAFYYDNRGDPEAVDEYLQWGWRTRFANLSVRLDPDPNTTIRAQAMTGSTRMGYSMNGRIWVDTGFRSAFLMATRQVAHSANISGRIEAFGTRGRGSVLGSQTSEDGWAGTLAAKRGFGDHVMVLAELLHVESRRDDRARIGLAPRQRQTVAQLAVRVSR
ncbi:hypothetical protein ACFSCW_03255 [Sphingomonas tabacisoli]|uniref:Alginate export domain-containing protein n=1 Tax=Sphingomonas tabacisoli TaxID=2249466 RepID=A0ABW4I0S3_9SPHN